MHARQLGLPCREHTLVHSKPATCRLDALKTKMAPRPSQGAMQNCVCPNALVRALRKQGHHDHQVRKREQPLIGADAGRFRCPCDEPQMTPLREIVHVLDANPRQAGDFRIGEDFLARLYRYHGPCSYAPPQIHLHFFDAESILRAALFSEQ